MKKGSVGDKMSPETIVLVEKRSSEADEHKVSCPINLPYTGKFSKVANNFAVFADQGTAKLLPQKLLTVHVFRL